MISVDELNEKNFFQFFYERCEELLSKCRETEKELFYPKFTGDLKDITESDITHENLTYTSFLTELLKKNSFLLAKRTQKGLGKYSENFFSHNRSKKYFKIIKLWKKDTYGLEKELYGFQYMYTIKTNGKGLEMPVFGLPIKKKQKLYQTYEILRVLSTKRKEKDIESYEKYFNSYMNRLANKFWEFSENDLFEDIKEKKAVTKEMIMNLKKVYKNHEDCKSIIKNLKEGEYAEARDKFEKDRNEYDTIKAKYNDALKKYEINRNDKESLSRYLQIRKQYENQKIWVGKNLAYFDDKFSRLQGLMELTDIATEKKSYDDWEMQKNRKESKFYSVLEDVLEKNYINTLILKYITVESKEQNRDLNQKILIKIKQDIVKYALSWNDILNECALEEIKKKICNDYSCYEPELIHMLVKKYPVIYRKMQVELKPFFRPEIQPDNTKIGFVRKKYKEIEDYFKKNKKFPNYISEYKTELAYFVLKDSYISESHHKFDTDLIDWLNNKSLKKNLHKENYDSEYIENVQKLIDFRIEQLKKIQKRKKK